jgi:hypothetical protein
MITEIPIEGFKDKLENSTLNYPQSTNPNAPRLFFNLLSVASRGGSKTFTCVKLIRDYETHKLVDNDGKIHPLRTFLISPTITANPIFNNLKSLSEQDTYTEYSDEVLQGIIDDIEAVNKEIQVYNEYKEAYILVDKTPLKQIKDLMEERPEVFEILKQYDYQHYKAIPQPRWYEKPVNFLILDDLMGSSAFNKKAQSLLTYYLIKNRHHFISFFILIQALKCCPKSIRSNCNLYFLGKFASKKIILDDLFEEVSNVLTMEQFEEVYSHSIKEKYGSLIIDNTGSEKKFYKGLDCQLVIGE